MMVNNLFDRMKLPFRKEKELYSSLYSVIGFYPHNIEIYKQALMHKSVSRRNSKGRPSHNERLEFLGDAILDAIVGDIVFRHFEGKREGFLTNTRSKIVQRETLNRLANEMGISRLIKSSNHSQAHNSYMEGNAFEALVGAIYLDRGYEACMRFMQERILSQLINLDKVAYKEVNFKSKLIEWCQKNKVQLEFKLTEQKRDDKNSPIFSYLVLIEGLSCGKGQGYSKKESQQVASKQALQALRRQPKLMDEIFATKANRTKMEETPVLAAPDIDTKVDFIIPQAGNTPAETPRKGRRKKADKGVGASETKAVKEPRVADEKGAGDDFDLSDIKTETRPLSREDIIAEAEAKAFSE